MITTDRPQWIQQRIVQDEIDRYLPAGGGDFIPDGEIFRLLGETGEPSAARVRELIAKALAVETLTLAELAELMRVRDEGLWDEMRAAAGAMGRGKPRCTRGPRTAENAEAFAHPSRSA